MISTSNLNSKLVNGNFNSRVVKSSRLLTKIASYLVRISWLLCLAFLYGWHFLNKISQDWLLTLTTQPSTSKLSDNPVKSSFLEITFLSFWQTSGNSYSSCCSFTLYLSTVSHIHHPQMKLKWYLLHSTQPSKPETKIISVIVMAQRSRVQVTSLPEITSCSKTFLIN